MILTPERRREIGAALLLARPVQVPWKTLEERFGVRRATLLILRKEALGDRPEGRIQVVTEEE